jgi:hypothetical protein
MTQRRSITSNLYKVARYAGYASALSTGGPTRLAKRVVRHRENRAIWDLIRKVRR